MSVAASTALPGLVGGSIWDILAQATFVSLLVLALLLGLSVCSWAVILQKWRTYRRILAEGRRFRAAFHGGRSLAQKVSGVATLRHLPHWRLIEAGINETESFSRLNRGGIDSRSAGPDLTPEQKRAVADTLERVEQEEIGRLEEWTILLATTANVSPFLGLLGTCWGIINAFVGIGATGSASLVVVAPGIAEALLATVVGLGAAIPAVIGYNWCVRKLRQIGDDLSGLSLEFLTELTRENVHETAELPRAL